MTEKIKEKGDVVPTRLQRELERASEQRDGGQRLYKLDLRKSHLTDDHVGKVQGASSLLLSVWGIMTSAVFMGKNHRIFFGQGFYVW